MIKKLVQKELAYLARVVYEKFRPFVIGITGSSGKTTTKYLTGELLKFYSKSVYVAEGNLNTEFGVPLSVLKYKEPPKNIFSWFALIFIAPIKVLMMRSYDKYLIIEYAADKPGDIEYLTSIIKPDIAIITNIGVAHIEQFKNISEIAREKWNLALSAKDEVIISPNVHKMIKNLKAPKAELFVTGDNKTANAQSIKTYTNKTEFDIILSGKKSKVNFNLLGIHNIDNLLLAVLAASKVTGETEFKKAIEKLEPVQGRGERFFGRRDILVIDESYNANPISMISSLSTLADIKYGRKVAILGEMKEIGPISEKSHEKVAEFAKKIADFTVGVGDGFKESGLDRWYVNVTKLKEDIESILNKNDVVLVKGSHSNELEKIIEKLK